MALDEALLQSAVDEGRTWLRIYRWDTPTISLGYFQSAEDIVLGERFANIPQVRRLSGGGAILHHHEWTYSCHFPASHPLTRDPVHLYDIVHEALLKLFATWGVHAQLRGATSNVERSAEPFLCFGRGDSHDIVLNSHKIVGSAQRRRKGAIAQHGSILLRRSSLAPEFPGLLDLGTFSVREDEMGIPVWIALAQALGFPTESTSLPDDIQAVTRTFETERYRTLQWSIGVRGTS